VRVDGIAHDVGVSIGIAIGTHRMADRAPLVRLADAALYAAKDSRLERICLSANGTLEATGRAAAGGGHRQEPRCATALT